MIVLTEELRAHLKKIQTRATLSLIATLSTMIAIGFGILFLFVRAFVSVIFFAIAALSIVYLIYSIYSAKLESQETVYEPVRFTSHKPFSFSEIVCIFEKLTNRENQISVSEDVRFYRFHNILKLRVVLYRTAAFKKKEYDKAKDRMNKKANKALNIEHWVNRMEARKMMRFNIIYSDTLTDELYRYLSQNASRNLTRVEGILPIAIIGNQLIIPPIYGKCDLLELNRYTNTIRFIHEILLNRRR